MKFFQFLFGIVIAQLALFAFLLVNDGALSRQSLLHIGLPSLIIALVIALWFGTIAKVQSKEALSKVEADFAAEREKIKINAERAKMRAHKEAQKQIVKETAKAHAKANFKVGAAFAGLIGVGALFVMAQMVTAGILLISAGAGALGGYYLRSRQAKRPTLPPSIDKNVIEVKAIEKKSGKTEKKSTRKSLFAPSEKV